MEEHQEKENYASHPLHRLTSISAASLEVLTAKIATKTCDPVFFFIYSKFYYRQDDFLNKSTRRSFREKPKDGSGSCVESNRKRSPSVRRSTFVSLISV